MVDIYLSDMREISTMTSDELAALLDQAEQQRRFEKQAEADLAVLRRQAQELRTYRPGSLRLGARSKARSQEQPAQQGEQLEPEAQLLPPEQTPEQIVAQFQYDHNHTDQFGISLNFAELSRLLPESLQEAVSYFGIALSSFKFTFDQVAPNFEIHRSHIPEVVESGWENRVQAVLKRLNSMPEAVRVSIFRLADEALGDASEATKLVWKQIKIGRGEDDKSIYQTVKARQNRNPAREPNQPGPSESSKPIEEISSSPDAGDHSRAWHLANTVVGLLSPDDVFIP